MTQPLKGIKVVEVSMWAFVPAAGAVLADMGAEVVKIEPPTGDPIRGLTFAGIAPGTNGFTFMWEIFNRGKKSVTIDLAADGALELLHRMLDDADVFLTSLLPAARHKLGIDIDDLQARHPSLIYAIGSGQGAFGDDAEKGGYDAISFWARGGIASAVTPDDYDHMVPMPGAAFGDGVSGALLAGGVAAAVAHRERTGEATVVDGSLLATAMWALQPGIVGSALIGVEELAKITPASMPNPLVHSYRTADNRYVALCMLQSQHYWRGFCDAIGRPELTEDQRFADAESRMVNSAACVSVLTETFRARPLDDWRTALASQEGQWDVVQKAGEVARDPQATANTYLQEVEYRDGRSIKLVSSPIQFGREALPARPAPGLGADTDDVLTRLGLDSEAVLALRIAGVVE